MEILDKATSLLEQRFLKNAFLPALLLPLAILAPTELRHARVQVLSRSFRAESGTVQLLQVGLALALVWFIAAVVASQWRNIIRLFEGYPLMAIPGVGRRCADWYWRRAQELNAAGDATRLYYFYPTRRTDYLPTRLGNVLRAAERYPLDRYGADTIFVWPRLYHLIDREVVEDVEDARASLEFLLVICLWFVTAGTGAAALLWANQESPTLALACVIVGLVSAYLTYVASIWSAVEYGEQLRTVIELYRIQLLEQLQIEAPVNLGDELTKWKALLSLVVRNSVDEGLAYVRPSAPCDAC